MTQKVPIKHVEGTILNIDRIKFAQFMKTHGCETEFRSVNFEEVKAELQKRVNIMSGENVEDKPWEPLVKHAVNAIPSNELITLIGMAMFCFPGKKSYVVALIYCICRHSPRSIRKYMDGINK